MNLFLRQRWLMGLMAIGTVLTLLSLVPALAAQPPIQQKMQVPGYFRMILGDLEVTALYDGSITVNPDALKNISNKDRQSLFEKEFQASTPGFDGAVNAYLVNTGHHLILVDAGGTLQCTPGDVTKNLRAAGYAPDEVDMILLTHLHIDHVCGLSDSGNIVYPNATVYISQDEANFWLDKATAAKAPAKIQMYFKVAQDSLAPYIALKKLKTFKPQETLIPGLTVINSPGHTPGHISYLFSSKGQNLLVWGDIIHSHAVQLARPEVAIEFDTDSRQAVTTRYEILKQVATNKYWVGGAHMPFPGLGHIRKEKEGYVWVPIDYSTALK